MRSPRSARLLEHARQVDSLTLSSADIRCLSRALADPAAGPDTLARAHPLFTKTNPQASIQSVLNEINNTHDAGTIRN